MRILPAAVAVAVAVLLGACSTADTATGPSQLRGLSYGVTGNSDNAAWVQRDVSLCGMLGSDVNGDPIFGGLGTVTHEVENNNIVVITCKGTNLINLSGRAQSYSGFLCGLITLKDDAPELTTDTHAVVAANGTGSMQCTFTKS